MQNICFMKSLEIHNLGPIDDVSVEFGDLTILVGPQASGKSVFLETLKLVEDRDSIVRTLWRYNYVIDRNTDKILNVYFGEGMSGIWRDDTRIEYDDEDFTRPLIPKKIGDKDETLFYIPAQRILSISDGRPKNFMEFDNSTPYILREFSETLRIFMQREMGQTDLLFPQVQRLKPSIRDSFNDGIFHDAKIVMEERSGQKKMFLKVDDVSIPFMAWSAGQKEFMPLLLAFYRLLIRHSKTSEKKYKYIVVEEPEMGLHPKAIISIILQILQLMQLGYKVVVSTHSAVFMEFAWAFNMLSGNKEHRYEAFLEIFNLEDSVSVRNMLDGIFDKSIKTYFFQREGEDSKVRSHDISSLDVSDDSLFVSEWGGLSEFSGLVSDVVSKYLVDNE